MAYASDQLSSGALNSTAPSHIDVRAVFLPVDSFSLAAGSRATRGGLSG